MSFILKALKKLENEKAARKAAPVEISSALLAPDKGHLFSPRKKGRWAVVTLLFIVCAGALYHFMHGGVAQVSDARKAGPPPIPASPAALPVQAPAAPPQAGAPAAQVPALPALAAAPPIQTPAPPPRIPAPAAEVPVPAAKASVPPARTIATKTSLALKSTKTDTSAEVMSPVRAAKLERKQEALRRHRADLHPESESQVQPYSGSPALTVSGIAYQDNPAESMAVVNGALVKSGTTVAGVQIERIFVDRVRFRGNGGVFDVPLAR